MADPFSTFDSQMMALALKLAAKGKYTTTPNPMVGCVITDQHQNLVGQGFHAKAGEPHAEVFALRQAGALAKQGTAYVTLEPCSHYGRTPPCADALIAAQVSRVVCAVADTNPQVSGSGFKKLRDAGIQVETGLLESQALQLNRGFFSRMNAKRPFVTVKLAASLDGRTALSNNHSKWITGKAARHDVQRLRAASCAVLTGADTVLADDPAMNVRLPDISRQPRRIIIDSQARVTPAYQITQLPGDVVLVGKRADQHKFPANVSCWSEPVGPDGKVDLAGLFGKLAEQGTNSLWVEAGATLAGLLVARQLVDELIIYLAPKLMGHSAKGLMHLPQFTQMSEVTELNFADVRMVGDDLRITATPEY